MTFRLLTYNILRGGVGREDAIARVVAACAPDVVLLQEATRPDSIAAIAARANMSEWRAFDRQSLGYMSRRPVVDASWHRPRFSRHAFVEVAPAGVDLRLFGVHLSAVHAAWTERRRLFELRALLESIAAQQHGLHAIAGDFNTLAPGEELDLERLPPRLRPFVWLSGGRIKWRTIHTVIERGYVDCFRTLHPDDRGLTMPTWDPHVRLDYVFLPAAFRERVIACEVVRTPEAAAASDHFPVMVDLSIG